MASGEGNPPVKVDVTNCDREPIHIIGRSQSFGVILACDPVDFKITHSSENAKEILGYAPEEILGQSISHIFPDVHCEAIQDIKHKKVLPEILLNNRKFLITAHNNTSKLLLEFEPVLQDENSLLLQEQLTRILNELNTNSSIIELCRNASQLIRDLLGYDRVMLYTFDEEWNGEVIAESKAASLESWLGLHYPATDIPKPSRDLFLKQGVRMIGDVSQKQSAIISEDPTEVLDLSQSELRGISEIHMEYLKNMKVGASLTAALVLNGKLWGLIACHHYAPKIISYNQRQSVKFLTQVFTNNLMVKTSGIFLENVEKAKAIRKILVSQMRVNNSLVDAITKEKTKFTDLIYCSGGAVYLNGNLELLGTTPPEDKVKELIFNVLSKEKKVFHSNSIQNINPEFSKYKELASGVLSVKIGEKKNDCIIWFRKEFAQTVGWGGNPEKNAVVKEGVTYLSPRKSFEKWTQKVSGKAKPWKDHDLEAVSAFQEKITHFIVQQQKAEIDALNKKLVSANDELEAFSYSVSHDLRAPLRGISGYARILMDGYSKDLDAEGEKMLKAISGSAKEMNALINDLLSYAALDRSLRTTDVVDLNVLIIEILSTLNVEGIYPKTEIIVANDFPKVLGDRRLINQLFLNLISNGLKYSTRVELPKVEIGYSKRGLLVEYFVKDNGIGFDPSHSKKIFKVFSRLVGDEYAGSGVGLAIVKKIVDRHNGHIEVESFPGKGSIFKFTLASAN